jgi:hypothetical protein
MSQVVPRRGLDVPAVAGFIERHDTRSAATTGIGGGASQALPTGGEGLPQTPAERLGVLGPERVRAFGRATRSANGSGSCRSVGAVDSSARHSPHARPRLAENRLQLIAGGPRLLTEDRQKTETGL